MNYTDFSQVPIIMNVTQLAKVLDKIGRAHV